MNNQELLKFWNRLSDSDKLEIIEQAIEDCYTSEGALFLRLFRNGSITASIQTSADNHLCAEAVSQDTLMNLFGDDYGYQTEDAKTILNRMNKQK